MQNNLSFLEKHSGIRKAVLTVFVVISPGVFVYNIIRNSMFTLDKVSYVFESMLIEFKEDWDG